MPPDRGHVAALVYRFLWDYNTMLANWSTWARDEIQAWSDTAVSPARFDRAPRSSVPASPSPTQTGQPDCTLVVARLLSVGRAERI